METHARGHKPLPILLDRLEAALKEQFPRLRVKRSQAMEIAAKAFGFRNSNEMAAAARDGGLAPPAATSMRRVSLDGKPLMLVHDPVAGAAYAVEETALFPVDGLRGSSFGVSPYGHLLDLASLRDLTGSSTSPTVGLRDPYPLPRPDERHRYLVERIPGTDYWRVSVDVDGMREPVYEEDEDGNPLYETTARQALARGLATGSFGRVEVLDLPRESDAHAYSIVEVDGHPGAFAIVLAANGASITVHNGDGYLPLTAAAARKALAQFRTLGLFTTRCVVRNRAFPDVATRAIRRSAAGGFEALVRFKNGMRFERYSSSPPLGEDEAGALLRRLGVGVVGAPVGKSIKKDVVDAFLPLPGLPRLWSKEYSRSLGDDDVVGLKDSVDVRGGKAIVHLERGALGGLYRSVRIEVFSDRTGSFEDEVQHWFGRAAKLPGPSKETSATWRESSDLAVVEFTYDAVLQPSDALPVITPDLSAWLGVDEGACPFKRGANFERVPLACEGTFSGSISSWAPLVASLKVHVPNPSGWLSQNAPALRALGGLVWLGGGGVRVYLPNQALMELRDGVGVLSVDVAVIACAVCEAG